MYTLLLRLCYFVLLCHTSVFCEPCCDEAPNASTFPPQHVLADNFPASTAASTPMGISKLFSQNKTRENNSLSSFRSVPSNNNTNTEDPLKLDPLPPVTKDNVAKLPTPVILEGGGFGGLTTGLSTNKNRSDQVVYKDGLLSVTDSATESHHRSGRKRVDFNETSENDKSEIPQSCLGSENNKCNMTGNMYGNISFGTVNNASIDLKDKNNDEIPSTNPVQLQNIMDHEINNTVTTNNNLSNNTSEQKKPRYTLDKAANALSGLQDSVPSSESRYVIPVVAAILVVPLLIALFIFLYRRGADFWERRHYRRMDFLIDGMYND